MNEPTSNKGKYFVWVANFKEKRTFMNKNEQNKDGLPENRPQSTWRAEKQI